MYSQAFGQSDRARRRTGDHVGFVARNQHDRSLRKYRVRRIGGDADDSPAIVDVAGIEHVEFRLRRNEEVQIGHRAALPNEPAAASALGARLADDLAFVVYPIGYAKDIARQRAEVAHDAVLPEESMRRRVSRDVRITDDLPPVVDRKRDIVCGASEIAEVDRRAALPE